MVRLTIRGAGSLNLLKSAVIEDLRDSFRALGRDRSVRAIVLSGAGERAFVGGADIKELAGLDKRSAKQFIAALSAMCQAVRSFPAPVIARIPGWCLGGGLELAIACDFRIASSVAKFALPEIKLGIPSVIHAALLPRLIGWSRARWMMMTGEAIDAAKALEWGLVDTVAGSAALDQSVEHTVAQILACGPKVVAAQKTLLRQWEELPLGRSIAASIPVFANSYATGEPSRYMREFLARKNKPR